MPGRVGVLRCRYRMRGPVADPHETRRLDRLAAERLPAELDRALGAWGDDGAVYVVRHVQVATVVHPGTADAALARGWSGALARSVAQAIADGGGGVVRFASQADFVEAFVADLLAGRAWERWYFGAFARYRHWSVADAVVAVLTEHRADLARVLAGLARRGLLDTLLGRVDAARLGLGPLPRTAVAATPEGWRPLVAAAVRVVCDLGWWCGGDPDLAVLSRDVAGTAGPEPDWRDPAALADAVAGIVDRLVTRGWARPTGVDSAAGAMAGLDWLDRPRLAAALTRADARPGLPVRIPGATPRQRAVLAAMARAVRPGRPPLDLTAPAAGAARLLAALAEEDPGVAADPLATVLIEHVIAAWAAVRAAAAPGAVATAIAAGDPTAAVAAWGADSAPPADTEQALMAAARLGEPAATVLAALGCPGPGAGEPGDGSAGFHSPVAGVLLLARPLLDLRLAGSAARAGYPPAGSAHLVATLGLRWAGPDGTVGEALDGAVRLLAGDAAPRTVGEVDAAWRDVSPDAHARWRDQVDELLAAHHVTLPDPPPDPLDRTAAAVLRVWARWMRGFDRSSTPFLLEQFVRRPGTVVDRGDVLSVHLPRRPLDTVLEMSGYLRPVDALPGTGGRRIEFVLGELR